MSKNETQQAFWRSDAGQKWVTYEDLLDTTFAGVLSRLFEKAGIGAGQKVLDIGCGTGISTATIAGLIGDQGHVDGADISDVLLKRAEERSQGLGLTNTGFILADAQTHPFAAHSYDCMFSRFGVMFFEDPIAAFKNIAQAIKPGGLVVFAAWGALTQNPWFAITKAAAVAQLGTPEPADPTAPGPLAFQDAERVCGLLSAAGMTEIDVSIETIDLTPPGSYLEVANFATRIGPAARLMIELNGNEADAIAIEKVVAGKFKQFETMDGVRIPATLNLFMARC